MTVGWFKKGFFLQKLDVGAASTKTSGLNVAGPISASTSVTASKGLVEAAQKLTHSTGQAALNKFGLSVLSATAASTYTLGPPSVAGIMKYIAFTTGSNNLVAKTTTPFANSTATKITRVASKKALVPVGAILMGATGSKWAVVGLSGSSAVSIS